MQGKINLELYPNNRIMPSFVYFFILKIMDALCFLENPELVTQACGGGSGGGGGGSNEQTVT